MRCPARVSGREQDWGKLPFMQTPTLSLKSLNSVNPRHLGTTMHILAPELGNTDYRSKSYFRVCGARLRKPCQNHLAGLYFLDLILLLS